MLRSNGFAETIVESGVDKPACIVTPAPTNLPMGRHALGQLIDEGFRAAIFCSSDALALGVMIEAQACGLAVPDEIAVV